MIWLLVLAIIVVLIFAFRESLMEKFNPPPEPEGSSNKDKLQRLIDSQMEPTSGEDAPESVKPTPDLQRRLPGHENGPAVPEQSPEQ